jgi:hypothetical protein
MREEMAEKKWTDPEPDPETSPAVLRAFQAYASEQFGDQGIADLLNREGFKPSGRARSGRWTREGVRYMLANAFYVGKVRHGQDLFPGRHEPLISQELWDQVQAIRRRRGAGKARGRKPHRMYLLARLVHCQHCGLPLTAKTSGGRGRRGETRYYFCPAIRRSVDCPAAGSHVVASAIEAQVVEYVRHLRLPEDWRSRLVELANQVEERSQVEGRYRYLESKLRRVRELYVEGDFEKPEYIRRKSDIEAQLAFLQMPEPPAVESAASLLEGLAEVWDRADRATQHEALRAMFAAIRVDVLERKLVSVQPHRDFLPLFRLDGLEEKEDGCFYYREDGDSEPES